MKNHDDEDVAGMLLFFIFAFFILFVMHILKGYIV